MDHQQAVRSESLRHQHLPLFISIPDAFFRFQPAGLASLSPSHQAVTLVAAQEQTPVGSLAPHQLKRAIELLLANLNGSLGIIEIAQACNLTRSHFSRAFKLSTGLSPVEWRLRARLERAKELLATSLSLAEVGLEAGFCDQSHFTRAFSRWTGKPPKVWRADIKNGLR